MNTLLRKLRQSLSARFILTLFVPILVILLFGALQFVRIYRNMLDERETYCSSIHLAVEQQLVSALSDIEKTSSTLVQSAAVQQYFSGALDYRQQNESLNNIKDIIRLSSRFNTELVDVMFCHGGGRGESMIGYTPREVRRLVSDTAEELSADSGTSSKYRIYRPAAEAGVHAPSEYVVYLAPVFSTYPSENYSKRIGYVAIVSTVREFSKILSIGGDAYAELHDSESGELLLSGTAFAEPGNGETLSFESALAGKGFSLTTKCDMPAISAASTAFTIGGTLTLVILYFLFVAFSTNTLVLRPIRRMNSEIAEIGETNPNMRLTPAEDDEVGSIVQHINSMLDNIQKLNQNVMLTQKSLYEAQIEKSRSQLYAFQSQVAPHFLFNTLQCIRSKAFLSSVPEIADMCGDVSTTLRYVLSSEEIVPLSQELDISRKYLKIVAIRFQDKITYQIHIGEGVNLNYRIPKMILQPLVENAVYHGMEPLPGKGHLDIQVRLDGDVLELSLIDNGIGMDAERLAMLQNELRTPMIQMFFTSGGADNIGLLNVHNRLRLRFGNAYGVSIDRADGKTVVQIRLPGNVNLEEDG